MIANDPHLEAALPSMWLNIELIWGDNFLAGSSFVGCPLIAIGRSKNTTFTQTSPNSDASDLWQETLDETKTKYFVDGKWHDLQIETVIVKVKNKPDYPLTIRRTHRGPVFTLQQMIGGNPLFGHKLPKIESDRYYSMMHGAMFAGDNLWDLVEKIGEGYGVK